MTSSELRPGLYRLAESGPVLVGGRCNGCGALSFPRTTTCFECGSENIDAVDVGGEGTLFCETTVQMKTDRYAAGYVVGYVSMPNGLRVFGQFRKPESHEFRVGDPMKVEIATLWHEGADEVVCYRFAPTGSNA